MRGLVVSIHDVSPLTRETVAALLADLQTLGLKKTSLLVIPDHHRRGNITADRPFREWLPDQVAGGHEAVLHGYFHRRERRRKESAFTRAATRFYTADEGEFFDIALEPAREALRRGREELAECAGGLPAGFIAPAWLLSPAGEMAAREMGFSYTARLRSVTQLQEHRSWDSQSLCWSVRSGWRRQVSLVWNARLFRALRATPLLRISLHPPDFAHPAVWAQVRGLISRALAERPAMTYAEWVTRA